MSYATQIYDEGTPGRPCGSKALCDYNFLRHPGWTESECLKAYFSQDTVNLISKKVSELTRGVDPKNRKIIVPDSTICSIMDAIHVNYRPPVGDIYSRYIIPNTEQANMVQSMIDQTIEVIVSNVRGQIGMEQQNQTLSAWVQVYGDFSANQLKQRSWIKTLEKRPSTMQFQMNY